MPATWTNELTLEFLKLYATERLLWDTTHKHHKCRHKVIAAWQKISENLGNIPIEELKFKKKSLMATFRPLLKKKMASMRGGATADDVFNPIWFAYQQMESFLGSMYDGDDNMDMEEPEDDKTQIAMLSPQSTSTSGHPPNSDALWETHSIWDTPQPPDNHQNATIATRQRPTKSTDTFISEAQKKINESLDTLNNALKRKGTEDDECDMYAKLLARKLRKYPETSRDRIMYKIDGLLLENPPSAYSSSTS